MPLDRTVYSKTFKAQRGRAPLNERFTEFMKQKSSGDSEPKQSNSSDKNKQLAINLEKKYNDLDQNNNRAIS